MILYLFSLFNKQLINTPIGANPGASLYGMFVLLTLVALGCLAPCYCQSGHHGVSTISNSLHGPGKVTGIPGTV